MMFSKNHFSNFYFFLMAGILVNASGLFMTIPEPDADLYAGIAKTMAQTNDFINLKDLGTDWLDKPHFPFWLTAISFKIFGYTSFAYRLPAFIFWLMGAFYTWKFAKVFYNDITAKLSVLIYITAAHLVISNSDVRAEPFLTGLIIASVYHFYKAGVTKQILSLHVVAGSLFAACALMTKGLFTVIPVAAGLLLHWIMKKEWAVVFSFKWLAALLLISIFILPELYCLYMQFDLHPEKVVFGKTNVSGIRFFFWDSQFGRFFNTGPIKGEGDLLFYVHTALWAFLPWSLILYAAVFSCLKKILLSKNQQAEFISIGASATAFLMFSFSSFQLPHYLNIVFPFFAIISAHWLLSLAHQKNLKIISGLQLGLSIALAVAAALLPFVFSIKNSWVICGLTVLAFSVLLLIKTKTDSYHFILTYCAACILYLNLNLIFYPQLLKYQGGSEAAFYLNSKKNTVPVYVYELRSYSFEFYNKLPVAYCAAPDINNIKKPFILFTKEENLKQLGERGFFSKIIKRISQYPVSRLSIDFLNPATRMMQIKNYVLVIIE
ncbi:MAG: glycosyltransferase family 39 protein [Chitinophagaceae bacterium]|nr:glycosyltransferase family 39 protein [Chitinophagaceae bacterium]